MKTIKHFVLLSLFAGVVDMIVAGVCGMLAFIFSNSIFKGSYALSAALFVFIGTTAYYRVLLIPITVIFEQKKVKLLLLLSMTPVIFVIGFFSGVCSLVVVSCAYFFVSILTNYEYFVIQHNRERAFFG